MRDMVRDKKRAADEGMKHVLFMFIILRHRGEKKVNLSLWC